MDTRRVVITGVGPVSSIGVGRVEFFKGLKDGRAGIKEVTLFDSDRYLSKSAAELSDFDVEEYLESQKSYLDRASEFALAAMSLAREDAGLDLEQLKTEQAGLLLGSAFGSLGTAGLFFDGFLEKGPRLVKPFLFPHTYSNTAISLAAIEYDLTGYHVNFASGRVSASCAVAEGYDVIRQGRAEMVFAGGYEALTETLLAGYDAAGDLSPQGGGDEVCAPFDRNRNGFVLGEGGGVVVLEELKHARARKARIYGEITGAGLVGDSTVGVDGDNCGEGIAEAMRLAFEGMSAGGGELDYISASANGSMVLDRNEARAIRAFLSNGNCVPVTSIKGAIGETLGAGGVLQLTAALAAIEAEYIPATMNLESPEDGFGLNLVENGGSAERVQNVLLNSIDPGGSIVSLAVSGRCR